MEHHSLSLGSVQDSILNAYREMAFNLPGVRVIEGDWGIHLESDVRQGIGNFAFCRSPKPWQNLDLAIRNPSQFHLYLEEFSANPPFVPGFRSRMSMQTLVWTPKAGIETPALEHVGNREAAARMAIDTFYTSASAPDREAIEASLLASNQIDLIEIADSRAVAALVKSSHVWGLYCVCVKSEFRGQGLGRQIVRSAQAKAAAAAMPLQLQCEDARRTWYLDLGFVEHSFLHIYCLS